MYKRPQEGQRGKERVGCVMDERIVVWIYYVQEGPQLKVQGLLVSVI